MVAPINDVLFDRAVRHGVYVNRYASGIQNRISAFLTGDLFPDLEGRMQLPMEALEELGTTPARIKALKRAISGTISSGFGKIEGELSDELQAFALTEAEFNKALLAKTVPVEFTYLAPQPAMLKAIVTEQPFQGAVLSDWFDGLEASTQMDLERSVRIGLAEGESITQLRQRVRGSAAEAFKDGAEAKIIRNIEAVVRTATNHVSTAAREAVYEANDDLVKGVRWMSTLDTKTTPICQARDGKVYKVDSGPRPPAHFNCRSTTTAVLKSWKELGIDLEEAPKGTRASMNGQVPRDETYAEWIKKQPASIQNEALGKRRAELLRAGKLNVKQFVNNRGRPLTLRELEKKEGIKIFKTPKTKAGLKGKEDKVAARLTGEDARKQIAAIREEGNKEYVKLANQRGTIADQMKEAAEDMGKYTQPDPDHPLRFKITDQKKWEAAQKRLNKLEEKLTKVKDRQNKISLGRNERIRKNILYHDQPGKPKLTVTSTLKAGKRGKEMTAGTEGALRMVGPGRMEDVTVKMKGQRGYRSECYSPTQSRKNLMERLGRGTLPDSELRMTQYAKSKVAVHEWGHAFEDHAPGWKRKALDFYESRTAGDPVERLVDALPGSGYRRGEKFKRDRWGDDYLYCGKQYLMRGEMYATEVVSMGMERMWADPVKFMESDPEYFDFVFDLMHG